ncbi:putative bifunctional diguanylate cyclase/phosphodiesterase [Hansschlegelia zhihuaiae]|uniref:putative bifunctional diguanylate cyclase/phosphodiesterase n=1 Tax=Hansschlegelia zhihuaiae TaxID=405005 RepID=UPI0013E8E922|nr:EAL domain-containing protein [Hansschlegelia zhihuaiae]
MRNRVKIFDGGMILVFLAVAALFLFEVDVFRHEADLSPRERELELDELMILTSLVMLGVLFYTWRRAREHRRENALRIEAEKEVMSLALQDPLTGLPNRRQFDEALKAALTAAPVAPEAHALFMLDLNDFKKINDVHGHPTGDQALIHVGSRLLRAVRDNDLVARLGGDEFAILARNVAGAEGAANIARRVVDGLATPIMTGALAHSVGVGIGIALSPHDGDDPAELLRRADVALYRAKAEKRSAIRFFEPEMDARLRERAELERALADGLDADDFFLRFQPTTEIGGGIAGFEALPRWRHAARGELEPERFLPIAEEIGLLSRLTERLLRDACREAAAWPAPTRLAFNLPGALLADQAFGSRVIGALDESGLPPDRFDLEIDEGALIRDAESAMAMLTPLRAAGVSLVAARFGTGYSDLKNLHKLKLDRIKIDRSYVAAMTSDRQAAVMVKALIGIGRGLDLSVIADGVGTEEQLAYLASHGCQQAQGAAFGAPVSAEQAAALVRAAAQAEPAREGSRRTPSPLRC